MHSSQLATGSVAESTTSGTSSEASSATSINGSELASLGPASLIPLPYVDSVEPQATNRSESVISQEASGYRSSAGTPATVLSCASIVTPSAVDSPRWRAGAGPEGSAAPSTGSLVEFAALARVGNASFLANALATEVLFSGERVVRAAAKREVLLGR
jgi:hypothetical protein